MSAEPHPKPGHPPPESLSSGWLASDRPAWLRYGVAIALTVLSVWLRIALAPADSGGRFVTAALAVALAALYGGLGPGLVSTVLGMVLVNFFMVEPYGNFVFAKTAEAFWLNAWHLVTQLVVVGAIALMQSRNRQLREAARQIREGQQRFLDTFEHAASGISHVDIHGRLLQANQTFCRLVGYSKAELEGLRFQDITIPDDLAPDLHLLEEALAGLRTSYTLEKRYRHKDGHIVWAQLTAALMRKLDGEPDYFISVVQDISAQKAADEALRTSEALLLQAQQLARMSAWQADLVAGRFRPLSDSHQLLGLEGTEYPAHDVVMLTHPDDRAGMLQRWQDAIRSRQPYSHEYRVIVRGAERWFTAQARFEYDSAGAAVRALGVTRDITEQKLAQLEVQRLNASLEQRIQDRTRALRAAYDELESYSYAVAHDLRSPLRIINGFAQALQEELPAQGDASQGHLARIMAASKKMGELIDGLLKLSQYSRGDVQRLPVNLSAFATRILEELTVSDTQRQVQWTVEPDLLAQADPALIEALMQNLLNNAWKYTASTQDARIRVFSREVDGAREYCVKDNGAGFDMARADKLFQPFQRMHQPHEFAGLGIGLATSRRIVQRHGGQLRASSAPGEGATFGFTLPDPGAN
jgi:PAS domain S-box-containing protein